MDNLRRIGGALVLRERLAWERGCVVCGCEVVGLLDRWDGPRGVCATHRAAAEDRGDTVRGPLT